MDAATKLGRNPVGKHQVQPEYEDEQADAGRDCRTRLARPNSGANGNREMSIFSVQLTTSRIGNLTRLILVLAICDDYTYLHAYMAVVTRMPERLTMVIMNHAAALVSDNRQWVVKL